MRQYRQRSGKVAILVLVGLVVAVLLTWMVTFKVEFTEHVLVQTFGKTTRVLSGDADAGLHMKWPFPIERVVRYDARTFLFEDTMNELTTNDKQNITLTTFCAWRIADPAVFQAAIETVKAGQSGIRTKLQAAKSAVIGKRNMEDLVNTDPQRMQIAAIEQAMLDEVRVEALRDYGADVVSIGIRSLSLPESVSDKVIENMKAERQREANRYRAAGQAQALAIRERAREASEQILAFADRKAREIRAEGDRAAAESYKEFEADWRLAAFLRSLESLKTELQGRAVFLLDGSAVPAAGFFRDGPSLPKVPVPPAAATTRPAR